MLSNEFTAKGQIPRTMRKSLLKEFCDVIYDTISQKSKVRKLKTIKYADLEGEYVERKYQAALQLYNEVF